MAIGEIAERFGLAAHVLRHWESMGLLAPARVEGDRRRYGRDDLYRVAVILRAKEAGFSLDDIREMIATGDPDGRRDILLRRHADLTRRVAEAEASGPDVSVAKELKGGFAGLSDAGADR
jgi:MerR family transcriptional regulator, copper efflux regulator